MSAYWCVMLHISFKFVFNGPTDKKSSLVQVRSWHHTGNKPLPEPMMTGFTENTCITRPQCVNARLWYLQSICSGDIAVLHQAMIWLLHCSVERVNQIYLTLYVLNCFEETPFETTYKLYHLSTSKWQKCLNHPLGKSRATKINLFSDDLAIQGTRSSARAR